MKTCGPAALSKVSPTIAHVMNEPQILRWFFSGQPAFMRSRGLSTHVIATPRPELARFGQAEQVAVTPVPITREITPGQDALAVVRVTRALRRIRPAVVHAHTPKGGLFGMIAGALAGSPVRIYHLHGLRFETATGAQRQLLLLSELITCTLAHRVICVSESVRQALIAHRLCPPHKATVLLEGSVNGIDATGRFDPARFSQADRDAARAAIGVPPDARVIGFVGRVVRDKGLVELAEAWCTLREEFPNLHLLLVGPFEPHDPLPAETETTLRQDTRVHLTGAVEDMPPMYATMDVVVLPTYREGYPNVLLEAAAMQLPVVATRVSGCVDAVRDGVTGTLTPPRDAEALAASLRRYLVDPELRRQHGLAARGRAVSSFRQEAIWEALHHEYASLLRQRGIDLDRAGEVETFSSTTTGATTRSREERIKRALDIAAALTGLILLWPLFAAVAIAILLKMGRPILFRHERAGRDGEPFSVVKFRTLTAAVDRHGRTLTDAERVTPLGWFLRRTSIDELPQLWNVLRGEMSLVGPRPLEDWYIPLYSERERLRLSVRPGITGLAQVRGRNILPWDQRLDLDARYVEEWSLWMDVRILARTLLVLLHGAGGGISRDPLAEGDLRVLRGAAVHLSQQGIAD